MQQQLLNGFDFASVLVKTREGRPIKIENNVMAGNSSANARVNASVLGLYDSLRVQGPMKGWKCYFLGRLLDKEVAVRIKFTKCCRKRHCIINSNFCKSIYIVN